MYRRELTDSAGTFTASIIEAKVLRRVVLFAVGAGGNPERHTELMEALAFDGGTVVAPHFDRLASPRPTADELLTRARRLGLAMEVVAPAGVPVVGVGHSIGAALLIALAGGHMWLSPAQRLEITRATGLERLVLLAPVTGFFRAPEALSRVRTPLMVWAGTQDAVTPKEESLFLKQALDDRVPVELNITEGAGHFTFMHTPPPGTVESIADRGAFLQELTKRVCEYVAHVR